MMVRQGQRLNKSGQHWCGNYFRFLYYVYIYIFSLILQHFSSYIHRVIQQLNRVFVYNSNI
jgi:hypothetical protein